MNKRLRAAIRTAALGLLVGLLIWHATSWHVGGQQEEMFLSIGEGGWGTAKAVLYNLGLVTVSGVLLGLLMEGITELFGVEVRITDHFRDRQHGGSGPGRG